MNQPAPSCDMTCLSMQRGAAVSFVSALSVTCFQVRPLGAPTSGFCGGAWTQCANVRCALVCSRTDNSCGSWMYTRCNVRWLWLDWLCDEISTANHNCATGCPMRFVATWLMLDELYLQSLDWWYLLWLVISAAGQCRVDSQLNG